MNGKFKSQAMILQTARFQWGSTMVQRSAHTEQLAGLGPKILLLTGPDWSDGSATPFDCDLQPLCLTVVVLTPLFVALKTSTDMCNTHIHSAFTRNMQPLPDK